MGVRARDPVEGEALNPELSVPPPPLLPRGPERHTPTPGLAGVGLEGSLPGPERAASVRGRRGAGGPGSRTLRPSLVAGLDQGTLDWKLPSGISLPRAAGPQTAGRSPAPAPGRGQRDSAPHTGHLVPARGPSAPHHGLHGLFILPCSPPTQTPSWAWGTLLPSPPSPCTFLSPFYLLGRGRGEGTGRRDSPCPEARWGHCYCGLPPSPGWGRLNKDRNWKTACLLRGADQEESAMTKGCLGGRAEAEAPLVSGGDSCGSLRGWKLPSSTRPRTMGRPPPPRSLWPRGGRQGQGWARSVRGGTCRTGRPWP